jgi:hypothetical protein
MPSVSEGEVVERTIKGVGELRFENFGPGEWLTKKGEPAKKARRRYLLDGKELDSVSSIVDTLDKSGGLVPWAEDHGARGAIEAAEMGELEGVPIEGVIHRVRALGLGAKAVKEEGADRGHAIHAAFQALAETGEAPKFGDYPQAWWPWVQGCAKAWLQLDPEPIDAEFMVCNPALGYAGRPDLLCRSKGGRTLIDYKSSLRGRIYEQAHYQTRLYVDCFEPCSIEPVERIVIVAIGGASEVRCEDCVTTPEQARTLIQAYRDRKQVNADRAAMRRGSV